MPPRPARATAANVAHLHKSLTLKIGSPNSRTALNCLAVDARPYARALLNSPPVGTIYADKVLRAVISVANDECLALLGHDIRNQPLFNVILPPDSDEMAAQRIQRTIDYVAPWPDAVLVRPIQAIMRVHGQWRKTELTTTYFHDTDCKIIAGKKPRSILFI